MATRNESVDHVEEAWDEAATAQLTAHGRDVRADYEAAVRLAEARKRLFAAACRYHECAGGDALDQLASAAMEFGAASVEVELERDDG